jgi:hypothetical protein
MYDEPPVPVSEDAESGCSINLTQTPQHKVRSLVQLAVQEVTAWCNVVVLTGNTVYAL